LLKRERPDIVHIDEEPYNLATYHANILARRLRAKTLWFSWQNLLRRYPFPFSAMERYNLRHVDYALMGSQSAAQVWLEKGYRGAFSVLPQFGVDPALFFPPAPPRPLSSVHLAYVGRLVPEKGVDLFIAALQGLEGAWRATILGSGPERERLIAQAQSAGLAERIEFRAPLPSTEMPAFYQTAHILVLPSRTQANWMEQFGRVLIEAMACGAVAVGATSGEIPAVIGDAGLVFPEADVPAFRERLAQLVTDPVLRETLAQAGRERVLSQFTQRHIALETARVYQALLA
jgi:glycosyltransferase involved in cell wall biosynthesis